MLSELERRLKGSLKGHVIEELFTNSIHFPLANIILELLLSSSQPLAYLLKLDPYIIIVACTIQAYFLGTWKYKGYTFRLLGNIIGPTIYTVFELILEGAEFFESPNHLAYWGFSLLIGLLQEIKYNVSGTARNLLILSEHLVRTNILLVTYWIFETSYLQENALFEPGYLSFGGFFSDHSHQYIAIVLILLGLVIGFANITAANYLRMLQGTAKTLRRYSEWFFGRELLSQAVIDSSVLTLQRRERTVLFMDIRGFTRWSETKTPEEVVTMLNAYFDIAEKFWEETTVIKVKHTGDEILAVFATAEDALRTAIQLREAIETFLRAYGLSAGIGLHCGQLVEGLIGSRQVKAYDIIGDTVNTGKRICDQAAGGEILVSQACYTKIRDLVTAAEPKVITAKGKKDTLCLYPVQGLVTIST